MNLTTGTTAAAATTTTTIIIGEFLKRRTYGRNLGRKMVAWSNCCRMGV